MKKHLKVIAKFLPDRTALTKQPEVDCDRPREDEDVGDADAEFHSFHLDAHDPALSKACNDWLELMVLHFDAVQRLINYVKKAQCSKIVIKIVSQSSPDWYICSPGQHCYSMKTTFWITIHYFLLQILSVSFAPMFLYPRVPLTPLGIPHPLPILTTVNMFLLRHLCSG